MKKNVAIQFLFVNSKILKMNKEIMKAFGFSKQVKLFEDQKCPFCTKDIDPEKDFRDQLSKREFEISGLCQECQDKTFKLNE